MHKFLTLTLICEYQRFINDPVVYWITLRSVRWENVYFVFSRLWFSEFQKIRFCKGSPQLETLISFNLSSFNPNFPVALKGTVHKLFKTLQQIRLRHRIFNMQVSCKMAAFYGALPVPLSVFRYALVEFGYTSLPKHTHTHTRIGSTPYINCHFK